MNATVFKIETAVAPYAAIALGIVIWYNTPNLWILSLVMFVLPGVVAAVCSISQGLNK